MKAIKNIIAFLRYEIWQIDTAMLTPMRTILYNVIKRLLLAIAFFVDHRIMQLASALTYSTLLAMVPILAVVFAIARGFGYNKYIEDWFLGAMSSQPQAAEVIVGFVNSYLVHTKSGIFLGVGLLFMLWTVTMLTDNIETIFNSIWMVKRPRSLYRKASDYFAMMFLVPILIVLMCGLSIFLSTLLSSVHSFAILGPLMRLLIELTPLFISSFVFTLMYICVPNTKVRLRFAIIPGCLAGLCMQVLQFFYINSQIWVSSYNAIYGSFAAIPLFMLWVQLSWTICLFGAQLTYTSQNLEQYAFLASSEKLSHRYRLLLSAMLLSHVCKNYEDGGRPYTALQLKLLTHLPIRITSDLLNDMVECNLLLAYAADDKGEETTYVPYEANISVGKMIDRLESNGTWVPDINLSEEESQLWREVLAHHNEYLTAQRNIPLASLCSKKGVEGD